MMCRGHNSYKQSHMNKEKLIREGTLPTTLQVDEQLVKNYMKFIRQPGNDIECSYDVGSLLQQLMWVA
ncbi:hypothetical protein ACS0TY_031274 [Phlomoides rotata]